MIRLRRAICLIFVLACAVFVGFLIKEKMVEDHVPPVITCSEDELVLSVNENQEEALMKGIKATDNRDGDLTKEVRISSISHFISGNERTVTYVVFDKSNQMGTLKRTVKYNDYTPPRIKMLHAPRCSAAEVANTDFVSYLSATDCLDGDLTSQVKLSMNDSLYNPQPGDYPVTAQVSNSAGDVCSVSFEITITDNENESIKQYPALSEYIVYTTVGNMIDPMCYVVGLEQNGLITQYNEDPSVMESISVNSKVDYNEPGVYPVEFSYTGDGIPTAVTKMFVVVEGNEDGK